VSSFLAAALQLTSTSDPDANFAAAEEQALQQLLLPLVDHWQLLALPVPALGHR
jgi:hypothetical protein